MRASDYVVLSPDGITIGHEAYRTVPAALAALAEWTQRYEVQGYYSTSGREHIPLEELHQYCQITNRHPFYGRY